MDGEFYIGYQPSAPPRLAARTRRLVFGLLLSGIALAATLVAGMRGFSDGVFEFGVERQFEGVLQVEPVPFLCVRRPGGEEAGQAQYSSYLLSSFGKRGAASAVEAFDGRRVRLAGSLVYRDDQTMIELVDGSIEDLGAAPENFALAEVELGELELDGEIVDSKCFLGVMKPGNLKPHRACAVRCISGGVPPVLVTRGDDGVATYYLLVSASGGSVGKDVLDLVAEPVRIRGRAVRRGTRLFLYADPAGYTVVR